MNAGELEKRRTVQLTTRGRKTGRPRTVTVWFVTVDPTSIFVQHVGRKPAQWYGNLLQNPTVQIDFGDGPTAAHAAPITDAARVQKILRLIRKKYLLAWVFQLLGRRDQAVAAQLTVDPKGLPRTGGLNQR